MARKGTLYRRLMVGVSAVLGMWGSAMAWADCTGTTKQSVYHFPANLKVAGNASESGFLLDTGWLDMGDSQVTCTGVVPITVSYGYSGAMATNPNGPGIYETGINGILIRVVWSDDPEKRPASIAGARQVQWPKTTFTTQPGAFNSPQLFRIQVIKYSGGKPVGGTVVIPPVEVYYGGHLSNRLLFSALTVNQVRGSCRVDSPLVQLMPAQAEWFAGIGALSQAQRRFNVTMSCEKGLSVSYLLSGETVAPNVLVNQLDNGAHGVGIQLSRDGVGTPVVPIGQRLSLGLTGEGGLMSIPLVARYYQTGARITPGPISAIAQITLFYD